MVRVEVRRDLWIWARVRSGVPEQKLRARFPNLQKWESGDAKPTLTQVEAFAKATYTPVGFLFLAEPPQEQIPIPDFRTVGGADLGRPSPNLLETIYLCQRRQDWYREFARSTEEPRTFVGSSRRSESAESVAEKIRQQLGVDLEKIRRFPTWTDALRHFIYQADASGILVMCSGVVLNNNHRRLDPAEFRGFSLADDLAPLIFINGADSKAAQMFTLAHEIAHIWLGETGVDDAEPRISADRQTEIWCNRVAAEILVPLSMFREEMGMNDEDLRLRVNRLSRRFKVSSLVILLRLRDAQALSNDAFQLAYESELARLRSLPKGDGGNFYLTQGARASKRFAKAIVTSTLEGQTLYRDAFRLLGVSKVETFRKLGLSLQFGA